MTKLKVAIIGCGGRGCGHAEGYAAAADVEVVACADPAVENATTLAAQRKIKFVYHDYRRMLREQKPDIVSICTWTGLHTEMAVAAAESGARAIFCEKPMSTTWADAKRIYATCKERGVMLAFCHQRRFGAPFVRARELIQEGAIGRLVRMEAYCDNLFDWGTHWFDMMFFYNNEAPAEWVMGQIDCDVEKNIFGAPVETRGISLVHWQNGVDGLMITGSSKLGACANRLLGTDGMIELAQYEGTPMRIWRKGKSDWKTLDLSGATQHKDHNVAAILDVIEAFKQEKKSRLDGDHALAATELIFATYESARRRQKISLPLDVEDASLVAMLERGDVKWKKQPAPKTK